ncbi:adenosylcobinamide-phosphate synthase CbiB [Polycladidibacter stylochi]|uniref:adenosylcobinamide-phosphate synthase CbiB n=1 Tax=Polycladidibacter stylochi TaxID=1807766 RepID=UPI00082AAB95|nr:adenosylcobinamide-phosphate synthase CbiB [Pseudovibrio stylochi]
MELYIPQDVGITAVCLMAVVLDALMGEPSFLWSRLPHPVVLIGRFIEWLERLLNHRPQMAVFGRFTGLVFLGLLVGLAYALAVGIAFIGTQLPYGFLLEVFVGAIFLAQRSLFEHVAAVRDALRGTNIALARAKLGMIVGRDTSVLDEAGMSRAAIESCAENYSDGFVAPLFWFLVLGLPGLLVYKAINTADSMVGHKTPRYRYFGWASARLDDLVNLPASRITGVLFCICAPAAGGDTFASLHCMWRDAPKHRSPNAGWPEAAMARVLGLALAGPRQYEGYSVDDPYMNSAGTTLARGEDITRALHVVLLSGIVITAVLTLFIMA